MRRRQFSNFQLSPHCAVKNTYRGFRLKSQLSILYSILLMLKMTLRFFFVSIKLSFAKHQILKVTKINKSLKGILMLF